MSFKEISPAEFSARPFFLLDKEWALLSAGTQDSFNTMTVSWGAMGTMWRKPAVTVYVRPQRYTKEFVEREDIFTLCFFDESYKKQLAYLGAASGRDENKVEKAGLTPCFCRGENVPVFKEAKLAMVCRKMYKQDLLAECFIDKQIIPDCYPGGDFHTMYIAEVLDILEKDAE